MKNLVSERVIQLGAANEYMVQAMDIMEQMDMIKHVIEKMSYESMNAADKTLNYSKEGVRLVDSLAKVCSTYYNCLPDIERNQIASILKDLTMLLDHIMQVAVEENASLHRIEKEVANHWGLADELRDKMGVVSYSINQATACDEMLLAMEV